MSRRKWKCLDCKVDTGQIHEHYFINTDTWIKVVGPKSGMLCIGCLETRLGRELNARDFTSCSINSLMVAGTSKSARLVDRLCRK